jgi:hypothetical protein
VHELTFNPTERSIIDGAAEQGASLALHALESGINSPQATNRGLFLGSTVRASTPVRVNCFFWSWPWLPGRSFQGGAATGNQLEVYAGAYDIRTKGTNACHTSAGSFYFPQPEPRPHTQYSHQ